MESLVDRVVNGKIFRNFASFVRRDGQSSREALDRPWTADGNHASDQRASTPNLSSGNSETFGIQRKRRASDVNYTAAKPPSLMALDNLHYATKDDDEREEIHNGFHESRSSLVGPEQSSSVVANPLPLTSPYMKIFIFQSDLGQEETGLTLPKNMVWQLNTVKRSEYRANQCLQKIHDIDLKIAEWGSLASELPELIDNTLNEQDRDALIDGLREAEEMISMNGRKREYFVEKFQDWTRGKELSLGQILQNLYVALDAGDLLEELPDEMDDDLSDITGDKPEEFVVARQPSPSPSQVAKRELEDERENAWKVLRASRAHLQEAETRLETWDQHCDAETKKFLQLQSEGAVTTKTDFDLALLQQGQWATRDCITAEEELEDAIANARMLKLDFEPFDQESCFISLVDDGHIESMDPAHVHKFDRKRIEKWLSDDSEQDISDEVDEWECKTVGIYDSVSTVEFNVAKGKDRKRIDLWRVMCGLENGEAEQEVIDETQFR